jgi:hypothetical protein
LYAVPEPVEVVAGGGRAGRSDLASAMVGSRSTHGCRGGRGLVVEEWEELSRKLHVSELDKASSVTVGQTVRLDGLGWLLLALLFTAIALPTPIERGSSGDQRQGRSPVLAMRSCRVMLYRLLLL